MRSSTQGMIAAGVIIMLVFLSNECFSTILKREVDLLEMLRTPLMLSFNRNSAFVTPRDGQNDYMPRLLGMRRAQRLSQRSLY